MENTDLENEIKLLVRPIIESERLELIDVSLLGPHGHRILRITIDKEGGINHSDCINISNQMSPLLDVKDFIKGSYSLEVSSPGINRPLKSEGDFIRFKGKDVSLKIYESIGPNDKQKYFRGKLIDFLNGTIILEEQGKRIEIPYDKLAKANLYHEF